MSGETNLHATACVVADRGILIIGASGSGKTQLALHLVEQALLKCRHAALVSDDQVLVAGHSGRLVCRRPAAIAGLAEIRPLGPCRVVSMERAIMDVAVQLVPAEALSRIEMPGEIVIAGVTLPCLRLAAHDGQGAARAVYAFLDGRTVAL